jgi:long-chain acyl-CoA synthetase
MSADTLSKIFIEQVNRLGDKTYLLYKKNGVWLKESWTEVGEKVRNLALGLMKLGVKKGDRIAGISETRPEYAYACTAIANAGAIFTGIYHTNSPKECAHVINDSGAKIIFAQNREQCEKIIRASESCHPIEKIIVFDSFSPMDDPRVMDLDSLSKIGEDEYNSKGDREYIERLNSVEPDDVLAIIYTSGTTGPPKGVMDTHGGTIRNQAEYTKFFPVEKNDRGLSFLPMAHALELRMGHWFHIRFGMEQVYAESMKALFDNVHETGPTFFFTTPRFFERHYNNISADIGKAPAWKKKLIDWCLRQGARYNDDSWFSNNKSRGLGLRLSYWIAEKLFINSVRNTVGKTLRYAGVGGAPMSPEMLNFFCSCGLPLYEGYGLTEGNGMISANRPGATKIGTVGPSLDGIEVKITDEGEILSRGWNNGPGYWNKPDETAELYKDGWLNTGDLGVLDEDGFLKITGRKKEILITSGGKNVSPSYIENILKLSSYINQAVVFGEGKDYLTAILTLNQEEIFRYAVNNDIKFSDYGDLVSRKEIKDLIKHEIDIKNSELAKIEQIRKFKILKDEFSQEKGEVTPTFKIKRKNVTEIYKDIVDKMYE